MIRDGVFVMIPNPHHGEKISVKLQSIILAPRCFLWVGLNSEVGPELSLNFQDTTIWDKTNVNRRIGSNHGKAVSKELRIDILRLPTRNSEEP